MKFTKRADPGELSGSFLKLKDGESINGVFRGEIHEFKVTWEGGRTTIIPNDDPALNNRFKVNFVTHENNVFVAKVWEFGVTVYADLASINEEYDLTKTKVKISRRGSGKETTYNILPLLKEPIPPFVMKEIEAVHLNILDRAPKGKEETPLPADELPF